MKECEEVRHDTLNLISYEHLIAIELNLIALKVDIALYAWEVEDTCEVEWEIYIEVNPEQRLILHRIECTVE